MKSKTIGETVKELRKKRRWTQLQLAEEMGHKSRHRTVQRIEQNNKGYSPNNMTWEELFNAFDKEKENQLLSDCYINNNINDDEGDEDNEQEPYNTSSPDVRLYEIGPSDLNLLLEQLSGDDGLIYFQFSNTINRKEYELFKNFEKLISEHFGLGPSNLRHEIIDSLFILQEKDFSIFYSMIGKLTYDEQKYAPDGTWIEKGYKDVHIFYFSAPHRDRPNTSSRGMYANVLLENLIPAKDREKFISNLDFSVGTDYGEWDEPFEPDEDTNLSFDENNMNGDDDPF